MTTKADAPWWADFVKEAMRSWGLAVIIVLIPLVLVSSLAYSRGGQWIDARLAVEHSNAKTNAAVAEVVKDIASGLKSTQEDIRHNRAILDSHSQLLVEAKQMMSGAPARGEKMISLLEELVAMTKARKDL